MLLVLGLPSEEQGAGAVVVSLFFQSVPGAASHMGLPHSLPDSEWGMG